MKIGDFPLVQRAIEARNRLVSERDGGTFGVTVNGAYQDGEMIEACRPAIVAVLDARIAELDKDLAQLGVRVG